MSGILTYYARILQVAALLADIEHEKLVNPFLAPLYRSNFVNFKACICRSVTIGCPSIGFCIPAIGSPFYSFRVPIDWPYVFCQLRFRFSLDLDISVSYQCTNYALHDVGSHGCFVLALVVFLLFFVN